MKNAIRYASQTTGVNFEKALTWGAIGAGLWLAHKVYSFYADAADKATSAAANAYVRATTDPVEVLGRVVLPNGQKIPMNDIHVKSDFTFTVNLVKYKLTKRRPDNDYDAVKV